MEHRNNVNLSLFIQLAKVNNKMNEKRSQEYQSMDPEYVTGKINSRILELLLETILLFDFCTVSNILICFSLIKRFPKDYIEKIL